jgi:hypothetical protein
MPRACSTTARPGGGYRGHGASFVDTPLALAALRIADGTYSTKITPLVNAVCALVTQRVTDSAGKAWPLAPSATGQPAIQQRGNVLATALALHELREMQKRLGFTALTCSGTGYTPDTVVDEARNWLLAQRNADNGYGERRPDNTLGPSSVQLTALVYRALRNLKTPPEPHTANALAYLDGQRNGGNGSWRDDALLTAQVLAVLPAAAGGQIADTDQDGLPDTVEARLGTNPSVADSRATIEAAGLAQSGVSVAALIASAVVGEPFSYTLTAAGGTGPYAFAIVTGALPEGLSLHPGTGQIAGTPSVAGAYSFDYRATDSLGVSSLAVSLIEVEAAHIATVPAVPLWGLLLLAGLLVTSALRRAVI